MRYQDVLEAVAGIPHMSPERGRKIYDFLLEHESIEDVLELGFAHGVSSCYIGAALQQKGRGKLMTFDRPVARERDPNIEQLIQRCGLEDFVEPHYSLPSFTWSLMKIIEERSGSGVCEPMFDFCYFDGGHTWDTTGFAFFIVDKLMRPGAWVLFDDLEWSHAKSRDVWNKDWFKSKPEDWKNTCQVKKVFDLIVRQHPGYTSFHVDGNWGWAQKKPVSSLQKAG